MATASAPAGSAEVIARRVPLLSLLDGAETASTGRAGTLRTRCPHCRGAATAFVSDLSYRCDACHNEGDALDYWAARTGLPYRDAIAALLERATTPAVAEQIRERTAAAEIAMGLARKWYADQFAGSDEARSYWESRGFDADAARKAGIGYAPRARHPFMEAMADARQSHAALEAAGLCRREEHGPRVGQLIPRMCHRLLFPIRDADDVLTVAFGGRRMSDVPVPNRHVPKWLNTPNSDLWTKSETLYGYGAARAGVRAAGRVVVVEGYFHVQRLVGAGVPAVVATCGTNMSAGHVAALKRLFPEGGPAPAATLLYDDGTPGRDAERRTARLLATDGWDVRVARIPSGEDDADAYGRAHGSPALHALLTDPPRAHERAYADALAAEGAGPGGLGLRARLRLFPALLDDVAQVSNPKVGRQALAELGRWFEIPASELRPLVRGMASPPEWDEEPEAPLARQPEDGDPEGFD